MNLDNYLSSLIFSFPLRMVKWDPHLTLERGCVWSVGEVPHTLECQCS